MRRIISSILTLVVFGVGVLAGTYYHGEIEVYWRHLILSQSEPVASAQTLPASPATMSASTSTLSFSQLQEPLPLVYSDTLVEAQLQEYLKEGAVVLPLGTSFGDSGNVVITAHSSGTAAFGPFRFAFAKLGELKPDQEFQVNTPTATYTYVVYDTEKVWPHEVDKLPGGDRSTVTLVTCWPLWTNLQRLLVHAELTATEYKI